MSTTTTNARGRRVLAVDDEPVNLTVIEGVLGPLGYQVDSAGDSMDAVEAMLAERPDLVLLDVMMPGGSGFELCRRMRLNPALSGIPVILLTALDASASRAAGLRAGADDYLEKPIQIDQLVNRVRALLARGSSTTDPRRPEADPRRRSVTSLAGSMGLDAEAACLLSRSAVAAEAAELAGVGAGVTTLADAMARAAGIPPASSVAGGVARTRSEFEVIRSAISGVSQ